MRGRGAATNLRFKNTGKTSSRRISGRDFAVRPRSGRENVAEICTLFPVTNLRFANLRCGHPGLNTSPERFSGFFLLTVGVFVAYSQASLLTVPQGPY